MPSCGTEGKKQRRQAKSVAAGFDLLKEETTVVSIDDYRRQKKN